VNPYSGLTLNYQQRLKLAHTPELLTILMMVAGQSAKATFRDTTLEDEKKSSLFFGKKVPLDQAIFPDYLRQPLVLSAH
jgi:hypothetical protein